MAEQLDTHRKRQQEQHPDLTMTGMYNVLEKLRSGGALTAQPGPVTVEVIARQFTRARKDRVEELLETLVAMGQARKVGDAQFVGG